MMVAYLKMLSIGGKGWKEVGAEVAVHKHSEPLLAFLNFNSEMEASSLLHLAMDRLGRL